MKKIILPLLGLLSVYVPAHAMLSRFSDSLCCSVKPALGKALARSLVTFADCDYDVDKVLCVVEELGSEDPLKALELALDVYFQVELDNESLIEKLPLEVIFPRRLGELMGTYSDMLSALEWVKMKKQSLDRVSKLPAFPYYLRRYVKERRCCAGDDYPFFRSQPEWKKRRQEKQEELKMLFDRFSC